MLCITISRAFRWVPLTSGRALDNTVFNPTFNTTLIWFCVKSESGSRSGNNVKSQSV